MPATERTCANCIYYDALTDTCHRYPPASNGKWGVTADVCWCGEWAGDFVLQQQPGPVA